MNKIIAYLTLVIVVGLTSCSTQKSIIPNTTILPSVDDNYSIVWVGKGKAYSYIDGKYQRNESNDYSFEVVQRRYDNKWKSVKNMHRIHPEYDGVAGEREQTMFFGIDFSNKGSQIVSKINSSLGSGEGVSDREFREQVIQFEVEGISAFAPYNTIRIIQHYDYEDGSLSETVLLFKLEEGLETPFAKIEEQAVIFRPTKLEAAPTVFK